MRWHIPGLRRDRRLKALLEARLPELPGVHAVRASTETGNILTLFDPAVPVERLRERIAGLVRGDVYAPDADEAAGSGWHARPAGEAVATLQSCDERGLAADTARERLAEYGANALPPPETRSGLAILFGQFRTLPGGLLVAAGAFSLLTGAMIEAGAILAVVTANAVLGTVVESRSERTIRSLGRAGHEPAHVVRDGVPQAIPPEQLVPGDLIELRLGTIVPADARVVSARDLRVSEAMLTGESLPVAKNPEPVRLAAPLAERTSMVFKGTAVTGGGGTAIVVATGTRTEMGRMRDGARRPLTAERHAAILRANDAMAADALRVLGFAFGSVPDGMEPEGSGDAGAASVPVAGLTWIGLAGLADPVRPGMAALMQALHGAGLRTVMMTGDQVPTARAVAKQLGLAEAGGPIEVFDAADLGRLSRDELVAAARRARVFARVSPAEKLHIIRALQAAGERVAMTGDGINDSPALKAADVGLAMGGTASSEAAREVADVVLQTDDLAALAVAVERGRTTYVNVRKSIRYLLATNLSEIIVVLGATAAGFGEPLTAMQLLWINLVSDVLPGLGLAYEPVEPGLMQRPPFAPEGEIVGGAELRRTRDGRRPDGGGEPGRARLGRATPRQREPAGAHDGFWQPGHVAASACAHGALRSARPACGRRAGHVAAEPAARRPATRFHGAAGGGAGGAGHPHHSGRRAARTGRPCRHRNRGGAALRRERGGQGGTAHIRQARSRRRRQTVIRSPVTGAALTLTVP